MARIATASAEGSVTTTLSSPAARQRTISLGDDSLLIGFAATRDGVPVSAMPLKERQSLPERLATGKTELKGDWAFISSSSGGLTVRTNAFGTKPLFWRQDGRTIEVADELWDLVSPDEPLDAEAIA